MRKFYLSRSRAAARLLFFALTSLFSFNATAQAPGNALSFNSVPVNPINFLPNQQFVDMPNNVVLGLSQDFTIEAWVYWRGNYNGVGTDENQRVFDFGTGTSDNVWLTPKSNYLGEDGVMFAFITTSFGIQVVQSPNPLPTNGWVHVAVTQEHATNTAKLYVNGVQEAISIITVRPSQLGGTNNNWLGRSQFAPDPYFNGNIEEFRISNVVRYTSNFTPPDDEFIPDANTVLLYHFSEGSGQTTADASGNGFNATLGLTGAAEPDLDPEWITNSLLPVKMEFFTAARSGNAVDLNWRAAATGEGGDFIVERSSDGARFNEIGSVDISTAEGSFNYSFRDAAPLQGKNFYRIRIAEVNAAPKYSNIVWVDMTGKDRYTVHPTATSSNIFISIPGASNISIYNASGLLVKKMQLQASQQVSVQELGKGLYHVRFEESGATVRFIKL